MEIWVSILAAIRQEGPASALPTRVQFAANLPHDRFWRHLEGLEQQGLITTEPLALTGRGQAFLTQFEEVRTFLARFGLADEGWLAEPPPASSPRRSGAHATHDQAGA